MIDFVSKFSLPLKAIALVTGAIITITLSALAWFQVLDQEEEVFATKANAMAAVVARKINVATEAIHGLAALYHASAKVDVDEFRIFSEESMQRHSHINLLAYIPKIAESRKNQFINDMIDDGYFSFSINEYHNSKYTRAAIRPFYYPVIYIEPFNPRNAKAMGFDFNSRDIYKKTIGQAIDSTSAITTYDAGNQLPFNYFLVKTIYAGKVVPESVDVRRRNANGVLAINLDIDKIFNEFKDQVDYIITLSKVANGNREVIRQYSAQQAVATNEWTLIENSNSYQMDTIGDEIVLDIRHVVRLSDVSYGLLVTAIVSGLLMTVLLYLVALNIKRRSYELLQKNAEIKRVVEQRTRELAHEKELLEIEIDERQRIELESSRLGKLVDESSNEIYVFDPKTLYFTQVNKGARKNLGYTMEELLHMTPVNLKPEFTEQGFRDYIEPLVDGSKELVVFETLHRRKDGTTYPVEVRLQMPRSGNKVAFIAMVSDLSETKKSQAEMKKLSSAIEASGDAVIITDYNGVIEYVNPAFETLTDYKKQEVVGNTPRFLKSNRHDSAFYRKLWDTILQGKTFRDLLINSKKDGSLYYEEKTITPIKNSRGEITHFISTGKDISERIKAQEHLHYLANHDTLTGLVNRRMIVERLDHALQQFSRILTYRKEQRYLAILFLDLDRFKTINDTLGHNTGDQLLKQTADRLLQCVREGDTVGRLGGDEFVVLLEDMSCTDDARNVAGKVLDALKKPFSIAGHEFFVNTSIGICVFEGDAVDAATMMKNADIAMYRAKDKGGAIYEIYSGDMSQQAEAGLRLETKLRYALERDEFELFYQPIIGANGTSVVGAEALIRWNEPDIGMVPPVEFIPNLEDTGLIIPVGRWVLQTALREAKKWSTAGFGHMRISVNLSGRQIIDDGFCALVASVIREAQVDASWVVLEITESTLMRKHSEIVRRMNELSKLGVTFAIDDFGTGYSSLSYLKKFPIQSLKIDRSFIRDMTEDNDDESIVNAIISMAHQLKLNVVAEGVETVEQAAILARHQCNQMQGYLFGKPIPGDEFLEYLHKHQDGREPLVGEG